MTGAVLVADGNPLPQGIESARPEIGRSPKKRERIFRVVECLVPDRHAWRGLHLPTSRNCAIGRSTSRVTLNMPTSNLSAAGRPDQLLPIGHLETLVNLLHQLADCLCKLCGGTSHANSSLRVSNRIDSNHRCNAADLSENGCAGISKICEAVMCEKSVV